MVETISKLPDWTGTAPQWGMLVLLLITAIRLIPMLRKQTLDSQAVQVKEYSETCVKLREEVSELMDKLHKCERQCAQDKKDLQEEINGMQKQRLAEQGAIMRAIVRMSGDPEVKKQLRLLEAMEQTLIRADVLHSQDGKVLQSDDEEQEGGA